MAPDTNSRLDTLTQMITDNHVETVQRLTRLETQVVGLPSLAERVTMLEHMKFKILGMAAAIGAIFGAAVELFRIRHS
jgi:hypothetical protein